MAMASACQESVVVWLCLMLASLAYVRAVKHLCPLDFPCPCDELPDKGGKRLHLKCQNLNLTEVPDLTSLKNIRVHKLDLSDNLLTTLKDDIFSSLTLVKWYGYTNPEILLDRNSLSHISRHAFRGLRTDTLRLQLIDNTLKQLPILPLKAIPNITELYLARNQIYSIPDAIFASFKKLRHIDLSGNKLELIRPRLFEGTEGSLESVFLRDMGLFNFPTEALKNLPLLKVVVLSENKLQSLPANMYQGFKSKAGYFILEVNGNYISTISPNAFSSNGTNIKMLSLELENNKIRDVKFLYDPCSKMFRVRHATIRLKGNPIECNCDLYSVANTGVYTLYGTCGRPLVYSGKKFDVWSAISFDKKYQPRYQTDFGKSVLSKACASNATKWDMTCAQYDTNTAPGGYTVIVSTIWTSVFAMFCTTLI